MGQAEGSKLELQELPTGKLGRAGNRAIEVLVLDGRRKGVLALIQGAAPAEHLPRDLLLIVIRSHQPDVTLRGLTATVYQPPSYTRAYTCYQRQHSLSSVYCQSSEQCIDESTAF